VQIGLAIPLDAAFVVAQCDFDISPIQDSLEDLNFLRTRAKSAPLGPCRNVTL